MNVLLMYLTCVVKGRPRRGRARARPNKALLGRRRRPLVWSMQRPVGSSAASNTISLRPCAVPSLDHTRLGAIKTWRPARSVVPLRRSRDTRLALLVTLRV